ncbi:MULTISPECIES: GNAT family N-acetyltransferase [Bradyrhizobium]|uniref:GNAT family N-acetyltransferase n=1 Tax=Bradyrhizobium TaxID=374 RepID=UPI00155E5BB1|nr:MULTISPECIES: GNAT family N-acetyltransferase [Bradyrhizobium]MDD1519634.1 GNAT family N-acetyltransferase [Bradyrhizobium sp. WBAH30]MDD1543878.1 GNAT family N-acetyltransferase [Bradyrhizobium sp. WBAH41]MDD1557837.1 GNAT family N-acetyltransferase [Bradyrhizobium sp. WBAH23]MDD1565250.1 GNAT family N-acetyltransferase [Bradyrhizobium sp. WBAH33]MDD1592259.1 GNAT family N-acetyltransferase [Bradyrhizobium sp. WBAH42]
MTAAFFPAGQRDNEDVALLPFSRAHLEGALKLSQEMSWPYRIEDWDVALQLGHGFVLQREGTVIGTAAWWPYGETHASAGMIIVAKAAQGRGYGARLMDALLASARPRTIALNSTAEGITLYRRRGFLPTGIIHQHQGIPRQSHETPRSGLLRPMAASEFEAIARLDRTASGLERRQLLNRLFDSGDGHVLLRDGILCGYAISRLFGRGYVIGPVVAESPTDARALIEFAIARLGPVFVRIDTPASSQLGEWLESIGLQQVSDATTMVLGTPAEWTGPARMFGLANQSFG